jgi:transcriptional regulator with XRE-family HTH domain
LHRTYISAIEREKRSIALDNVQKIADALEIETYKLFIETDIINKL